MVKLEMTSSPTPGLSSLSGEKSSQPPENSSPPAKKKRSLPGMPDPDSEVIALSPKTLMATNRFVCEICGKGFQRDQNLQLHRRGHNLPWKLRQRTVKDPRKRVYVCPEPSCVHHDPSRALGDLTGIKKHFSRKHGEKRLKCERCSKKYAVQSDWKAHMKTCGTKEYRCDCGTLFSRRDSFITHRAFCEALAQESAAARARPPAVASSGGESAAPAGAGSSPALSPLTPPAGVLSSPVLSVQSSAELPENQTTHVPTSTTTVAAMFNSSSSSSSFLGPGGPIVDPISLSLSNSLYATSASLFTSSTAQNNHYVPCLDPALSATALLQKAAQMGPISSNPSFLHGLWRDHHISTLMAPAAACPPPPSCGVKLEKNLMASGLGLGPPSSGSSGSFGNELMTGPSGMFGNKPATLDFLGLGMGRGSEGPEVSLGLSALFSPISGGIDMTAASFSGLRPGGDGWDADSSESKPSIL
ncbi:Protein indeterminate-domain 2 [Striga hermonthica]|uniref:Protein indeterminate-domain 2 n=1 Tax=Striga hermonthica TaxID=68872 RepID=A0A9N7RQD3_STRHE|nr:Protein indeterminate-domain 2 [Striga hermonthica]